MKRPLPRFLPIWSLLLTFAAILAAVPCTAAPVVSSDGYEGRDFWIAFPQNANSAEGARLQLSITISSESRTHGAIYTFTGEDSIAFSVEAGASTTIEVDTTLELSTSGLVENKAMHIVSDRNVSVLVVTHRKASTESYMAIPTPYLGREYRALGYTAPQRLDTGLTSQFAIIATEPSTMVTVRLTAPTRDGLPVGRTVTLMMQPGQTLLYQEGSHPGLSYDLTGSIVASTKPVAFLTGHRCAQVPEDRSFCDALLEMEPPVSDWGTEFALGRFAERESYVIRVLAREDSTEVVIGGEHKATLRSGYYFEERLQTDALLRTSHPALVAQYGPSGSADPTKVSDPFLVFVIPTNRYLKEVTASSVVDGGFTHYLSVLVPTRARASVMIDGMRSAVLSSEPRALPFGMSGNELLSERTVAMGKDTMAVLTYHVREGRHRVTCDEPVGVYAYGAGIRVYDAYGHACGERLEPAATEPRRP